MVSGQWTASPLLASYCIVDKSHQLGEKIKLLCLRSGSIAPLSVAFRAVLALGRGVGC